MNGLRPHPNVVGMRPLAPLLDGRRANANAVALAPLRSLTSAVSLDGLPQSSWRCRVKPGP